MSFIKNFVYSNRTAYVVGRHGLFWSADIVNYLLVSSISKPITRPDVVLLLLKMPLIILATYFVLYFLIPQISKKANPLKLFLWALGVIAFLGIGVRYYNYSILWPLIAPERVVSIDILEYRRVLGEILQTMVVVSMAIAIKLIKTDTETKQKNEKLVQEKKAAELNFLKTQMHPHFLFNTLNTLYSDAIRGTGKAEQIVLRLSNLLRFILEECSKPFITIGQEIKVIEDYIALEQLRHGDRLKVHFTYKVADPTKLISPLLLLPFIENGCKHTLAGQRGQISIRVDLKADMERLTMAVENELIQASEKNGVSHGIGIANIKKQLHLLYDKDYSLDIKKGDSKFLVNLSIPVLTPKMIFGNLIELTNGEESVARMEEKTFSIAHG